MPTKKPKKSNNQIRYGDSFILGDHRLLCADAMDIEVVGKFIGTDKISQINCDVPYGIAYTQSKSGFSKIKVNKRIINDELVSEQGYAEFIQGWLSAIVPHLAKKNTVYIFNSDKMIFALREGMEAAGLKFSQLLVWIKSHAVIGRKDYLPQHELIAYGWSGTHEFRRSKDKSVLFYPKPSQSPLHPTMKPVGLIRKLILNTTRLGDIVYDGFGGSGTCLIACEQTKRKCLMVELDPQYCQTIISRWEKLSGKKAEKVIQGKEAA